MYSKTTQLSITRKKSINLQPIFTYMKTKKAYYETKQNSNNSIRTFH